MEDASTAEIYLSKPGAKHITSPPIFVNLSSSLSLPYPISFIGIVSINGRSHWLM